jgi:hypothetical protein
MTLSAAHRTLLVNTVKLPSSPKQALPVLPRSGALTVEARVQHRAALSSGLRLTEVAITVITSE